MFEEFRKTSTPVTEPDEFDELIEQIKNEEIKLEKESKIEKNVVNVAISLFTIHDGKMMTLLIKKTEDPYKGYWSLPSNILKEDSNLEYCLFELNKQLKVNEIYEEQSYTFSNVRTDFSNSTVLISYIGFVDYSIFKSKHESDLLEYNWFFINDIPKVVYEDNKIIKKNIEKVSGMLSKIEIIKQLFPSDFTLHELQGVYEQVLNKTFDRRNFRKKFINLELIEETGEYNDKTNGRPSKLYKFKDNLVKTDLF